MGIYSFSSKIVRAHTKKFRDRPLGLIGWLTEKKELPGPLQLYFLATSEFAKRLLELQQSYPHFREQDGRETEGKPSVFFAGRFPEMLYLTSAGSEFILDSVQRAWGA